MTIAQKTATHLLEIEAVKLSPNQPFTWASGWKSPIYCDNRKVLAFPKIRQYLAQSMAEIIGKQYPEVEVIAGVATGAIAIGLLVAEILDKPFVYVRPKPKEHGMTNLIEGQLLPNQKVVMIEDLISTGGSSLKALEGIRAVDCPVLGMVAIFTYQFQTAIDNFKQANCQLTTLSDYSTLIEMALASNYISSEDVALLGNWRVNPSQWP